MCELPGLLGCVPEGCVLISIPTHICEDAGCVPAKLVGDMSLVEVHLRKVIEILNLPRQKGELALLHQLTKIDAMSCEWFPSQLDKYRRGRYEEYVVCEHMIVLSLLMLERTTH